MKKQTAFDKFFADIPYYPDFGYVISGTGLSKWDAVEKLTDYLFGEFEWIPRDKRPYLRASIEENIDLGWVKWHGFINEDGDMMNGWVLYGHTDIVHDLGRPSDKRFKPVYYSHFDKHLIEKGHKLHRRITSRGSFTYDPYNCLVCEQINDAVKQDLLADLEDDEPADDD